jgi:hypothetical protein
MRQRLSEAEEGWSLSFFDYQPDRSANRGPEVIHHRPGMAHDNPRCGIHALGEQNAGAVEKWLG